MKKVVLFIVLSGLFLISLYYFTNVATKFFVSVENFTLFTFLPIGLFFIFSALFAFVIKKYWVKTAFDQKLFATIMVGQLVLVGFLGFFDLFNF